MPTTARIMAAETCRHVDFRRVATVTPFLEVTLGGPSGEVNSTTGLDGMEPAVTNLPHLPPLCWPLSRHEGRPIDH